MTDGVPPGNERGSVEVPTLRPLERVAPGSLSLPPAIRAAEQTFCNGRRQAAAIDPDEPRTGLALSGGGIRSASFAIGVLQELATRDLLRFVDVVSSVSGGGYAASWLSSGTTPPKDGTTPHRSPRELVLDRRELRHLRSHASYLALRGGLSPDIARIFGSVTMGTLATAMLFVAGIVFAAGLLLIFTVAFTGAAPFIRAGTGAPLAAPETVPLGYSLWVFGVGLVVGVGWSRFRIARPSASSLPRELGRRTARNLVKIFGLPLFFYTFLLLGLRAGTDTMLPSLAWLPAFFAVGVGGGTTWVYVRTLTRSARDQPSVHRSELTVQAGITLLWIVVLTVAALVPHLNSVFHDAQLATAGAGATALAATRAAGALLLRDGSSRFRISARWAANVGAAVFVFAALMLAMQVLIPHLDKAYEMVADLDALRPWAGSVLIMLAALVVLFGIGSAVDFNRVSPHYLYRDRLADAFVRAVPGLGADDEPARPRVVDLHGPASGGSAPVDARNQAPLHLIVAAINLSSSDEATRRRRLAEHFVFSRLYSGSDATGWLPTTDYREDLQLAHAMTISGAAASAGMGVYGSFGQAIAFTILNLRLGYWMKNPAAFGPRNDPRTGATPGTASYVPGRTPLDPEHTPRRSNRRERRWLRLLRAELAADFHERGSLVNLSDGGHTGDNCGLYPLLQRRCRLVIVADASRDPDSRCTDFGNALRQADEDDGITVDINLDGLLPDPESGRSPRHFAVGTIHYPECPDAEPGDPDARAATGLLVYLKTTRCAGDPVRVESYGRSHEDFPHETTADQFFSDAQFEAYRCLGRAVTAQWLAAMATDDDGASDERRVRSATSILDAVHTIRGTGS